MSRVYVVDDHSLVRGGLCALLQQQPDIHVVGQAATFRELRDWLAGGGEAEVVSTDLEMPDEDGREALIDLLSQRPHLRVLVVSHRLAAEEVRVLIRAGIRGYVTKTAPAEELVRAVRMVAGGQSYFTAEAAATLAHIVRAPESTEDNPLTLRQMEVLRRVARGQTTQEVADALCLSPKTVEKYRSAILQRLGARNIVEAVELARKRKLLA